MIDISNRDFTRLVTFIKHNYGINLANKRQLIMGRLSPMLSRLGYANFTDYIDYIITTEHKSDIDQLLNRLTTNYTFFMREVNHFDYFKDTVLPQLVANKKDRTLSIWSAGCSSGQEPYTLSMLMKEYLGSDFDKWDTRILATDISMNALSLAAKGIYSEDALKDMPNGFKSRYFRPLTNKTDYQVINEIRENVIFRTFNLMDPIRFKRPFDVIFCRNVMIYFDKDTKEDLCRRFYNATYPGGYLFIGHSENLTNKDLPYEHIMPSAYRKPLR
ncbi:chemotaxis protein methyltransferase CheR [Lachnospiraceae bacterium PF1-21]|uniref:protein-glutamate O-methyltransferase n=1 Tax=Ohessyouella blattaphilus TaxID=2949333 RepID=A0ABT1EEG9_9FIRM|nr:protein-glutamate O-methyltransferase CheR [Ohessyouella blattaphilus]MCP1109106.1 protein-glutamate O-methyltransferase CheR [Ohessyouella blattaphilus]MCR8562500.1 protein-glutamate O-methyltransferase CheR [Ohessyouella blattaphilus]MDL2250311.1 protein-glutamate O-methyltransferase CheR [Lachnospiraceae bacterium OttesenSCG-928-J05]